MVIIEIKKRDGHLEEFDREKVKKGVMVAGLDEGKAEILTVKVENWALGAAVGGVIEAQEVWNKVVALLEAADPAAAESYRNYRG